MKKVTIWHNPRCSKSREAISIADENSADIEVFKYLDETPGIDELKNVFTMLGFTSVREWMRTKENIYKELHLKDETDEEKLFEAMAQNPKLIERPVLIKNGKAIIGRPTSIIADFLKS